MLTLLDELFQLCDDHDKDRGLVWELMDERKFSRLRGPARDKALAEIKAEIRS